MIVPVTGQVFSVEDRQKFADFIMGTADPAYGPYNELFEKRFASFLGVEKAFFVSSGSSANLLALSVFTSHLLPPSRRLQQGDEVITIAASFPTTVAPIIQLGAIPVFVDIDDTYNIDTSKLEEAYSPDTKGVFIAHTLGNPFHVDAVKTFCKKHDLFLIEDCCDAMGSKWGDKLVGTFGDISTFSFYPAHHISTGEGGMVCTSDPLLAKIILSMRNWGRECVCPPGRDGVCGNRFGQIKGTLPYGYDHKYVFSHLGYNMQATQMQAFLGCMQLDHWEEFHYTRAYNHASLMIPTCTIPTMGTKFRTPKQYPEAITNWFGFPIELLPGAKPRWKVIQECEEKGIMTRVLFGGNLLRQPAFTEDCHLYRVVGELERTDQIAENMFWIGCWHGLTHEQIEYERATIAHILEDL